MAYCFARYVANADREREREKERERLYMALMRNTP